MLKYFIIQSLIRNELEKPATKSPTDLSTTTNERVKTNKPTNPIKKEAQTVDDENLNGKSRPISAGVKNGPQMRPITPGSGTSRPITPSVPADAKVNFGQKSVPNVGLWVFMVGLKSGYKIYFW